MAHQRATVFDASQLVVRDRPQRGRGVVGKAQPAEPPGAVCGTLFFFVPGDVVAYTPRQFEVLSPRWDPAGAVARQTELEADATRPSRTTLEEEARGQRIAPCAAA